MLEKGKNRRPILRGYTVGDTVLSVRNYLVGGVLLLVPLLNSPGLSKYIIKDLNIVRLGFQECFFVNMISVTRCIGIELFSAKYISPPLW